MIAFGWPWAWWLLPLPLLLRLLLPAAGRATAGAIRIPFVGEILQARGEVPGTAGLPPRSARWRLAAMVLIWLLLVAATARPQWLGDPVALPVKGRDLMLAVDLSGSMQTMDFTLNGRRVDRLTAIKAIAGQFIARRTGDRLGLILFGDQAYVQAPLTFDRKTVARLLMESAIGLAGKRTAIGDAIGLAVKHMSIDHHNRGRVLILLTDGVNTAGRLKPREAADLAKAAGIRIYTIGIGADSMVQQGIFGPVRVNPSADLDERMLTEIAEWSGGRYFRARDSRELEQIYHEVDTIEPVARERQFFRPVQELYCYPLAAAFLLTIGWLAGMVVAEMRGRGRAAANPRRHDAQ
ncbi:MAG: VWA domain-containing protein [Zetaproteobacteria bacterium]|nr:MAG: VWA domain-containing protein [Zetaproteobacteria bacterium]